ncbi:hypothetical protein SDC9_207722 [bioreactor metagenome]|uniref:Uncharacterized protein n=1 Tax=bioreactor metagenome TaxID=1076179 RepID=A0A645JB79_9ZZZZ
MAFVQQLLPDEFVGSTRDAFDGCLGKVGKLDLDDGLVHRTRFTGTLETPPELANQRRQGCPAGGKVGKIGHIGRLYRQGLACAVRLDLTRIDAAAQPMECGAKAAELTGQVGQTP